MKKIFLLCTVLGFVQLKAQTVLNNAIIKATMEMQRESSGDNDGGMPMFGGGGETTVTIYLKDSMSKVETKSPFFNNVIMMDRATGISTTLMEAQGEKTAYTQTPADRAEQKRKMDSTIKANEENGGGQAQGGMTIRMGGSTNVKDIAYVEETKIINKINCKKAIITTANDEGEETKMTVWYTDAYAMPTGVTSGRGLMNFGNLKGIPVYYESARKLKFNGNEMTMTTIYQITEIKTDAKIEEKDFAIPKGYKVKTFAEWQKDNPNGGMPGVRMMIRG